MSIEDRVRPSDGVAIATVEVWGSTVTVSGEIDVSSGPLLEAALAAALGHRAPVRLDLGAVTFLDAAGLRALASVASADRGPGCVEVVAVSTVAQRVLDLVGGVDAIVGELGTSPADPGSSSSSSMQRATTCRPHRSQVEHREVRLPDAG